MSVEIPDGDLVRLARDGDQVAFRLLVERHQPMVRARARRLCPNPSDVDDIMQDSFLQAFIALDRLRDPDRFAGWLAGIVLNVCRGLQRRAQVTLLPDWPEPLHPASADGLPCAEDLDRADALRAAVADLPAGQRQAVALHYYADLAPGQIAESAGAARASLHKARLRLRAYLTEHRPDLVPVRRTHMTTVRVARTERRIPPGPMPIRFPSHVVVLADDAGRRELPIWVVADDGMRLSRLVEQSSPDHERAPEARTVDELTARLLRAAGASVTGVDIDELGPEVAAARIALASPAGTEHVTARLAEGLAVAIAAGAPVRVSDTMMDRLAAPRDDRPRPLPAPTAALAALSLDPRRRYEPRNLAFAEGLDGWQLGGSFTEHASHSHWQDYSCTAEHGTAVLSSTVPQPTVPQPAGFAFLGQELYAEDYRGAAVTFRGEFRTDDTAGADNANRAGLFLRANREWDIRGPLTGHAVLADPNNTIVPIAAGRDWTSHEVTAQVPGDADFVMFGIFLSGPGRIELRHPSLTRT
jgi:RNA polymerase sigma-70 factor (ECF subfamily)